MSIVRAFNHPTAVVLATNSYSWASKLQEAERGEASFVPAALLNTSTLVNLDEFLVNHMVFTVKTNQLSVGMLESRWDAQIEKISGFFILAKYLDCPEDSKFWMNISSEDVCPRGSVDHTPTKTIVMMKPSSGMVEEIPKRIEEFILKNKVPTLPPKYRDAQNGLQGSSFRVGQRVELLDRFFPNQLHPARIQKICGRRWHIKIIAEDSPITEKNARQNGAQGEFWVDQGSIFLHPVGFAAFNEIKLVANDDYVEHSRAIATSIRNGTPPAYHPDDVRFEDLVNPVITTETWEQIEEGQKFELLGPFAGTMLELKAASVLRKCESPGFIVVAADGEGEGTIEYLVHVSTPCLYPVGYAKANKVLLKKARNGLRAEPGRTTSLPSSVFRPEPPRDRLALLKIGMYLEAADNNEPDQIWPARIRSIHGRLVRVGFEGWGKDADQLYDIESHDLLPAGWCELHNYQLNMPPT